MAREKRERGRRPYYRSVIFSKIIKSNLMLPIACVLFSTSTSACEAVNKLHAHVYKEALLSVTLKKRLETLSKPITKPTKDSTDAKGKTAAVAAPSHASRLIVRNIPFNASEQDLRAVFLPYGPIYSIHIPLDERPLPEKDQDVVKAESSTSATIAAAYSAARPRTKGFAFVWMLSKKDAERAIEGCNGMVMRAGTAQTLVSDKQKKKKLKRLEKKAAAARMKKEGTDEKKDDEEDEEEKDEEMEEDSPVDDKRATERTIAVDWALSKDKWKEEKAKIMEDVEMEDASDASSDEEDEGLGVHSGGDEDSDDSSDSQPDEDDSDADEEPVKPELPPPEAGTTLFIRNIPFEATEEELRTLYVRNTCNFF